MLLKFGCPNFLMLAAGKTEMPVIDLFNDLTLNFCIKVS